MLLSQPQLPNLLTRYGKRRAIAVLFSLFSSFSFNVPTDPRQIPESYDIKLQNMLLKSMNFARFLRVKMLLGPYRVCRHVKINNLIFVGNASVALRHTSYICKPASDCAKEVYEHC